MNKHPSNTTADLLVYRPDIDGLRAVAVLSVISYHYFPKWVPGGFIGVDIFFVISGYLISRILFTQSRIGCFSLIDFYCRRIRRIFPALMVVMVFGLVIGWQVMLANDFMLYGKHMFGDTHLIDNFLFS